MQNVYGDRGTGRTTRMLNHAIECLAAGKQVHIVVATMNEEYLMRNYLLEKYQQQTIAGVLTFHGMYAKDIDWDRMTIYGLDKDRSVVLFDHHAVEEKIKPAFEVMHQFDLPSETK